MSTGNVVLEAALRWIKRGAAPVPVTYRSKKPIHFEWQKQRLAEVDLPVAFGGIPVNLGIHWGSMSGGLIDIDLDWPEAAAIAAALLPATAVYGRIGSPGSHRLYRVPGATMQVWKVPPALARGHRLKLVELRADGHQSVVPPSVHETGESYVWEHECKPSTIEHSALVRLLNLVAAGALVTHSWKNGIRHDVALALSGTMLQSGYSVSEVEQLITRIVGVVDDNELEDRLLAIQSSADSIAAGRPTTGLPRLAELVGEPVVGQLKKWLGLGSAMPFGNGATGTDTGSSVFTGENWEVKIMSVSDVAERPIEWLWPNRFPLGKLSMIAGKQGLSKSVLSCEIAAITSSGGVWPLDGTCAEQGDVLILSAEDDPSDTIRPRLRAADAMLERIAIVQGKQSKDGTEQLLNFADVALLDRYLDQHPSRFKLLVCDPVGAFMSGRDTHKDADVRELLAPLARLAEKHNLAVLLIAHLNKGQGTEALYRVIGSVAFTAAVRSLYILARDPDDEGRLLLLPEKINLSPAKMLGLSYRLANTDLGGGIFAPKVVWEAAEMRTADQVLNPPPPDREAPERAEAVEWLQGRLQDGPVASAELREEVRERGLGFGWRTVETAKKDLGITSTKVGTLWQWSLSTPQDRTPQAPSTVTR